MGTRGPQRSRDIGPLDGHLLKGIDLAIDILIRKAVDQIPLALRNPPILPPPFDLGSLLVAIAHLPGGNPPPGVLVLAAIARAAPPRPPLFVFGSPLVPPVLPRGGHPPPGVFALAVLAGADAPGDDLPVFI